MPAAIQEQLFAELLDKDAQQTLETDTPLINWSCEITINLGKFCCILVKHNVIERRRRKFVRSRRRLVKGIQKFQTGLNSIGYLVVAFWLKALAF